MIRRINQADIGECVRVIRESFLTVADEFGFTAENAPRFTAFAVTEDRLLDQLEAEHRPMAVFVDHKGKIVGYYSLALRENNECELNNLCVLPAYRHHRIGQRLLEDAFTRAREADGVKMSVGIMEENRVLRAWYERMGFVHTGTKKFDFFPFTCGYMERNL